MLLNRGFWAVVDQALFAGSNFLIGLLLARWLDPVAYGAISLVYSLLVFAGTLQSAFIIEPMIIYGSGRLKAFFDEYKQFIKRANLLVAFGLGLFFMTMGFFAQGSGLIALAHSFWGYAIAAPATFLFWLERQTAYVFLQPQKAALGSAIYLGLYTGIILFLQANSMLNNLTASLTAGVSSYFSARAIARRFSGQERSSERALSSRELYALHWRYGRWAAITNMLAWVPSYLPSIFLPVFHGLEAGGRFRAILNFIVPSWQFSGSISRVLTPTFVRATSGQTVIRLVRWALIGLTSLGVMYWLILTFFGKALMVVFYGGKYSEGMEIFQWFGLVSVLRAVVVVLEAWLRATENPRALARAYVFSLAVSLPVLVFLIYALGYSGAAVGILLAELLYLAGLLRQVGLNNVLLAFMSKTRR